MIERLMYLQGVVDDCRRLAAGAPSMAAWRLTALADKLEAMKREQGAAVMPPTNPPGDGPYSPQ